MSKAKAMLYPQCLDDLIDRKFSLNWEMSSCEAFTIIGLLREIRPKVSVEIGTSSGGSLSTLAHLSKKVYSLDINPACKKRLGSIFPNVEFVTGRSQETLPPILEKVSPEFILVDGDHERNSVMQDIDNILRSKPDKRQYILMHDSFNPDVRQGILDANWSKSAYVHYAELDFVPGNLQLRPEFFRQMWGGLALVIRTPEASTPKKPSAGQELVFEMIFEKSAHNSNP